MRVAVTGAGGGLGRAFLARGAEGLEVRAFPRAELDVTDPVAVERVLDPVTPDVILHLAAMTSVDGCEREPEAAFVANAMGTLHVALAARRAGALLVAMSTDYVFDGAKGAPYVESDPPNPLSAYARSKLAAEAVARLAPEHLVVRTSWVFGAGDDFVSRAMAQLTAGREVGGIVDQVGTPTSVIHLAERLSPLLRSGLRGTVHLAGPDPATWHDVLTIAVEEGGLPGAVVAQKADELARPAPRPSSSALASERLAESGIPPFPPLRQAVRELLEESDGRT